MQTKLLTIRKIKDGNRYTDQNVQTQNEDPLPVVSANNIVEGLGQMFEPPDSTGHRLQISVKCSVTAKKQTLRAEKTT